MIEFIEVPANKNSLAQRKSVFGFGINDADYITKYYVNGKRVICPYYDRWANMLERCYSSKFHERRPTYKGCSVHKDWLLFSNFKSWMMKQEWHSKHLDKDLLVQGNKVYSAETCLFVSPEINSILSNSRALKGEYQQGVHLHKGSGSYRAKINIDGKSVHLGLFDTEKEAFEVYITEKYLHIKEIAMQQTEPLRSALLNYKINGDK